MLKPIVMRYFLMLFMFISSVVIAQLAKQDTAGKITYIQSTKVDELLARKNTINERKDGKIKGFRVQIHFGADRDKAKEIKSKFIQKFNEVGAYEKYEQPNFKVRVGNFRTRLEAYKFLQEITAEFSSSFIVPDEIELGELLKDRPAEEIKSEEKK